MRRILPVLLLVACGDGASSLTIIDELRVLNVGIEPASPAPGEVPTLDLLVVDPEGAGFDTWTWWCVGETCGEGAVEAGPLADFWALACAPGACEGPGDPARPQDWMPELGFEGVSLVKRTVGISPSPEQRLNDNPILLLDEGPPDSVVPESTTPLSFLVEDSVSEEATAYGYATFGGFRVAAGRPVVEGQVTVEYVAPEEPGSGELYVVLEDGLGGSAVWTGSITVQ